MSKPITETFILNDRRSIKHLSRNEEGTETDAPSYLAFMLKLLELNEGWITQPDLEQAMIRNYGASWGPDDLRPVRVGNVTERPKWKNALDWAKVLGFKKEQIATRKLKGVSIIVSLEHADQALVAWALAKRYRNRFRKLCPDCRRKLLISDTLCICGFEFPPPNRRARKVPR